MKIFIKTFILAMLLAMTFFPQAQSQGKVKIVASFYPDYIMTQNAAKDVAGVSVSSLTSSVTGCLHDYTLTTNDMKKIADADIFIVNGAGMENFLEKVAASQPKLKTIRLSQGLDLIKDNSGGYNPHVWVSISGAIAQMENLSQGLAAADPANRAKYLENSKTYVNKLRILQVKMHKELDIYKGKSIITFHEAFPYFAKEFGFKIEAVVEREPGSAPSAQELARTIDLIKKSQIKVLFSEPQYPALAAQTIARETGAKIYQLDPAVTGPEDKDAYIKIMEENLKTLKKALSQ
jgi:zinc transport system substrate-binding protein